MARSTRTLTFVADAITVEGALIGPAMLARVAAQQADGQTAADYRVPRGLTFRDEIARYFRIGQALFADLTASSAPSAVKTTAFVEALFRDVFGFTDIARIGTHTLDSRIFAVTLEGLGGRVPVVVVPPADELDRPSSHLMPDNRRRSAASALQDWLNASENALWGLCCNGERLRLLRDNASLTRPAYIEADLRRIFEDETFADFTALWLLLHASRFGVPGSPVTDCHLERWRDASQREGIAARDRLRDGVEAALAALGTGFLEHEHNGALRERLHTGELPLPEFFGQLLRLVYRLIFLLTAEDRELLHPAGTTLQTRKLYAEGYSVGLLRDRAIRRNAWDRHHDRWEGLLITFAALARGEPKLALPALDGLFAANSLPDLETARLRNSALMEAMFHLAWLREKAGLFQVNWRDMQTEELGSVYESLLELTPALADDGLAMSFAEGGEAKGHARKTSGSYYTPDALVQILLDSALDPVLDRIEAEADDPARALLDVTVIDPACGSGHFLLAAARRIATRLAKARAGDVASANDFRHALRDVVRSCIYGVDRNSMAVELTKVALWIESVEPGRPLGFLDPNIRCGDALLGIFDLKALAEGVPDAAYRPLTSDDKATARYFAARNRDEKRGQGAFDFTRGGGRLPAATPLAAAARTLHALPEDTLDDVAEKRRRFEAGRTDPRLSAWQLACDLYVAAFVAPKVGGEPLNRNAVTIPTTEHLWMGLASEPLREPLVTSARKHSGEARAFHWPLEFPDIMAAGGFDVVLGNPPWERIKLQEQEFFAARDSDIATAPNAAARGRLIAALAEAAPGSRERALFEEFEVAKRMADASSVFARESGRYALTGKGDVNTYALFAEHFLNLVRPRGRAGVIVPTGISTDATTASFFGALLENRRLFSLHDFQTGLGFFDRIGHARFKFCLLTMGSAEMGPERPSFSFFSRTPSEFADYRRHFTISAEEIARINPNTKTAAVFRARVDADLTSNIYKRVPVLLDTTKTPEGNPWGLSFARLFDMSNDSSLFRTAAQLGAAGFVRDGVDWIPQLDDPDDEAAATFTGARDAQILSLSGTKVRGKAQRYVPLYEAKFVHHFDHRWATYNEIAVGDDDARYPTIMEKGNPDFEISPRYWVQQNEVRDRLAAKGWTRDWLIGWRDISNATNERTVISTAFPRVAVGNKIPIILPQSTPRLTTALISNLAALVLDYVARQKMGGTTLNFFILFQFPILPPTAYSSADLDFIVPRTLELTYTSHAMAPFARDLGYDGAPFGWAEERRAVLRAELDAWYARAYGLNRDQLRYVLDPADVMGADYPSETFRVLKQNETRQYGEYRTARLVLDAWDRLERGEVRDSRAPTTATIRTVPPPVDFARLPDGAWANPAAGADATLAQLAALIRALPGPRPISQVRLAALFALEPRYLTPLLSAGDRATWSRLVGPSAEAMSGTTVTAFAPSINANWRNAVTQLRATRAIIEDTAAQTWAVGPSISQYEVDEAAWPYGRATFVLKALETISLDQGIRSLPAEDQSWVKAHAA